MSQKSIINFEGQLKLKYKDFTVQLKEAIEALSNEDIDAVSVQKLVNDIDEKSNDYFEHFELSIIDYDQKYFEKNKNILSLKIDSTVNNLNSIINYWKIMNKFKDKYDIILEPPSERAYSTMQRFLKAFDPEKSEVLKKKFKELNLPIYGFNTKNPWVMKKQIKLGIILGTVLLIALLVIILYVKCPTEAQNNIFTVMLALSGAAFSMVLTGQINVGYSKVITASGALGVFLIIFFWKPTQIQDFTNCPNGDSSLKATVFYGENPEPNVSVLLIKQNINTNTNVNGNFSVDITKPEKDKDFKIRFRKGSIQLDTTININSVSFNKSLDIKLNKHCVRCSHKDSLNNIVRQKTNCSAQYKFIKGYIDGYTNEGNKQKLITECKFVK